MEKIFLPYLDTVCDEVTLEFEHESKQDIIKMKPRSAKSPYIKEKIASVNHLFQLQKRWSGQLERYFYTRMQAVSYTHLDVYKRQTVKRKNGHRDIFAL